MKVTIIYTVKDDTETK